MEDITIKGTVYRILDKQTFPSGFEKQELVVKTDGEYPQLIKIEFHKGKTKDNTTMLDNIRLLDNVEVGVNLRGTEHKGNFFNSIVAWKIGKVGNGDGLPF